MSRFIKTSLLVLLFLFLLTLTTASQALAAKDGSPDTASIRLAIEDLGKTFPGKYDAKKFLAELDSLEKSKADKNKLIEFQKKALLRANPLLHRFDRLLAVKRGKGQTCLTRFNAYTTEDLSKGTATEVVAIEKFTTEKPEVVTLYKPEGNKTILDVDLHFSGKKFLFSMPGENDRWAIFEYDLEKKEAKQLTPPSDEIDFFDGCYLPNGRIMLISNAVFQGLPCENGRKPMACMFLFDPSKVPLGDDGKPLPADQVSRECLRQVCFEQDSDWCPTVLNNGRVMYLRWEYTDTPHYFSRILFSCNPDGTGQVEHYGSGSYWPNSLYHAQPIPGHPTQFVGTVSGHHDRRDGKLILFDPAIGRHEVSGVVQAIPGRDEKVEPKIADGLYNGIKPAFLQVAPLGTSPKDGAGRYFLAAAEVSGNWGIYLVDVFDNMTPLYVTNENVFLEPIPLTERPTPPVVPDRVNLEREDSVFFITDVYEGKGLAGVPRDKVKDLRIFAYHYSFPKTGHNDVIGVDSSWDVKQVLGTVPVEKDGSVMFRGPSCTPISIQPLDEEGRAMQIMRSWTVGQPGETVSCVGCHEEQNDVTPAKNAIAGKKSPVDIKPWKGVARGFDFLREVQPVLDKYCLGCHDGKSSKKTIDGKPLPNFADITHATIKDAKGRDLGPYPKSYYAIHPFVRRPGAESDIHMFRPMEYHATTSELVQKLETGHHGVKLDRDAWERINTWIDLNAPCYGTWTEAHRHWANQVLLKWIGMTNEKQMKVLAETRELRKKYKGLYAGLDRDPESEALSDEERLARVLEYRKKNKPVMPKAPPAIKRLGKVDTGNPWPMSAEQAKALQKETAPGEGDAKEITRKVKLPNGKELEFVWIPPGAFIGGGDAASNTQANLAGEYLGTVKKGFWISTREITNEEFAQFNPNHDSRYIDQQSKDHTSPGYPVNGPQQPVSRVSHNEAMKFCEWLTQQPTMEDAKLTATLPTPTQWEWAARAGTATPLWFGDLNADSSNKANLSDTSVSGFNWGQGGVDYLPRNAKVNDKAMVANSVGRYQPNPWGLYDVHGNVAELTTEPGEGKVSHRGGSWRDRAYRASSSYVIPIERWQKAANVGFRVVLTVEK